MIALTALLGFCGIIFEFLFAQSLAILFGQTAVQYSVAIGLFLAGMGLGSQTLGQLSLPRLSLWRLQVILALLVPASLLSVWILSVTGHSFWARTLGYLSCFSVGALTGAEIPLLLRLHSRVAAILASDYAGMLIACGVFPLFLLPSFGIFKTLFLISGLNAIAAIFLRPNAWLRLMPVIALIVIGFIFESGVRDWLGQTWLDG